MLLIIIIIIFHITYGTPRPQNSVCRQARQLNQETLRVADFSTALSTPDVNEAGDNFMITYNSLFELSCPAKHVKIKKTYIKREPWITSCIYTSSQSLRKKPSRASPEAFNK